MNRRTLLLTAVLACGGTPEVDPPADMDTVRTSPAPAPPGATPVDSGAPRLLPVDEADSSFRVFRERMLQALARRDTTFLYGILSPDIRVSFGPDGGIAGFKRIWKMDEPGSQVWGALSRVLRLGGKLADSTFTAPYVFAFWPDSIDAFQHVAVIGDQVSVYTAPEQDAQVAGTVSYSILQVEDWLDMGESFVAADTSWARVRLPSGDQVWLRATEVYSPISWRAFFERRGSDWIMTLFVAGD